ncbi:hypothetical protein [Entomobacter blattae]|uniref:hypothetical protein n=1 Tax=Entomobacter blattae TaxID=2762277 RepID=UPI00193B3C92|nr:hypothetical protein [Entomobacter blattae]
MTILLLPMVPEGFDWIQHQYEGSFRVLDYIVVSGYIVNKRGMSCALFCKQHQAHRSITWIAVLR